MLLDDCFAITIKRMLMFLALNLFPFAFVLCLIPFACALFCFEIFLYFYILQESEMRLVWNLCKKFSFVSVFQALIRDKLFGSVFFLEPAIYEYSFLLEFHVIAFRYLKET